MISNESIRQNGCSNSDRPCQALTGEPAIDAVCCIRSNEPMHYGHAQYLPIAPPLFAARWRSHPSTGPCADPSAALRVHAARNELRHGLLLALRLSHRQLHQNSHRNSWPGTPGDRARGDLFRHALHRAKVRFGTASGWQTAQAALLGCATCGRL